MATGRRFVMIRNKEESACLCLLLSGRFVKMGSGHLVRGCDLSRCMHVISVRLSVGPSVCLVPASRPLTWFSVPVPFLLLCRSLALSLSLTYFSVSYLIMLFLLYPSSFSHFFSICSSLSPVSFLLFLCPFSSFFSYSFPFSHLPPR